MPAPSTILLLNNNAPAAFLLQRALQQAQLAAQTVVVPRLADAVALLASPTSVPPLRPCLFLVDGYLLQQ